MPRSRYSVAWADRPAELVGAALSDHAGLCKDALAGRRTWDREREPLGPLTSEPLPWARTVTYWGDLDSPGFAILNRLRARGVEAKSALMDAVTLFAHRDLWGLDPDPNVGVFERLTPAERATLQALSAEGNIRLEQEQIAWSYALTRLGVL